MSGHNYNHHNKQQGVKKGSDSFVIWIIVVTVLILGGAVYFGSKIGLSAQVTTDSQVSVAVKENRFDWGTIDINGGIVSKTFTITNEGSAPLKLYEVKTSCTCTTAQLKTADQTSKKFAMHDRNTDVFEVQPQETAELVITFDPAFHGPSGVGPASRVVTINTNDVENPTLTFQLMANVVKL